MRDAAPFAALGNRTVQDFVSARYGCYVYQQAYGMIDLAAACMR